MNLVSSRLIKLAAPFALGLLAACGAGVDNMGADGSYGFDGAGWTRVESASKADRWLNGGKALFVSGPAIASSGGATPSAWAQKEFVGLTTGPAAAPQIFPPKAFSGKHTGVWFGWQYEGKNVYEYYFVDDGSKKALQAEISGVGLSEVDAAGVLGSIQIL